MELGDRIANLQLGDGIGRVRSSNGVAGTRLGLISNKNWLRTISSDNRTHYRWSTTWTTNGNSLSDEFTMEYCI